MRKRFWVGLMTCLFATFSMFPFVAMSEQKCKQGVCAEARVYGSSRLTAKARVSSTRAYDGRWTYSIKAGNNIRNKKRDQQLYWRGFSMSWDVEDYTATASAYASNHAKRRSTGKTIYVSAYDSSGG